MTAGRVPATRQKSAPEPLRSEIASPSDSTGREMGEELIDLEGARKAEPHALARRKRRHVATLQQNLPLGRLDDAGQEIDQGGLAGAVGTDQRLTRAWLDA